MREAITGVVLAGGLGRRMGGVDKGLQEMDGRPLAARAAARLAPQVDELLINANRNVEAYAAFGFPVIRDELQGFAGPLAGLHTALAHARHPLVATVPCDSPFLPTDLVARMSTALVSCGATIAVVRSAGRLHPVFCLCRRAVLPGLQLAIERGELGFERWIRAQHHVEVDFDDQPSAFCNINTPEDLAGIEREIQARASLS
jgi:molybdopterin-guanine dinucleotide biosynthesis protein A